MSPPNATCATLNGITGTRLNAETKRQIAGRAVRALKAAGLPAQGWRVRWLINAVEASGEVDDVTDEQVVVALMTAPWFRNRPVLKRQWAVSSS